MKLIIDIPEERYKKLKEYFVNDDCGFPNDLAIAKGIPLQTELMDIKTEIDDIEEPDHDFEGFYYCLDEVLKILDKHIKENKQWKTI